MPRLLTVSRSGDADFRLRAAVSDGDTDAFVERAVRLLASYSAGLKTESLAPAGDEDQDREATEWLDADLGDTLK